ncbi:Histone-lysine N-methyltransferase SET9 [Penicillium riverlandense]|uniref:Histone-lysine N-methyltransferase SET9 n=1 Tax=Penicillium riverlandense TaxID=1903569 RepID=UPI00254974C8|nr:Histone-lysine N-methyltransferase SET9 [Penicillium riverlandense]KAJ5815578.1 Histone-lysine N-methyltransferase SET9 [Penicillium riverlandense]
MPPKRRSSPPVPCRERLTLAKLASYDDVATDALVDRVSVARSPPSLLVANGADPFPLSLQAEFWTNTRKNRTKYSPARGIHNDDVAHILLHDVVVAKDVPLAERKLLDMPGLKKYMNSLPTPREKEWFRRHIRKYIQIYHPDCPFEVTTTNRYTITEHEAAIGARKSIKKNEEIRFLAGTLVPMTREEELDLGLTRKDFSIVMSSRRKNPSFFLGPARFANHDCDANGRLVTRGNEGMSVVATRNIAVGEEITVSYGDDYFGIDNCECLCSTCEQACRNGWSPHMDSDCTSKESTPASIDEAPDVPLSGRKRRRGSLDSDVSSSGCSTPLKKAKFQRPVSKLREEISVSELATEPATTPETVFTPEISSELATGPDLTPVTEVTSVSVGGTPATPAQGEYKASKLCEEIKFPDQAISIEPVLEATTTDCESSGSPGPAESHRSSTSTTPTSVDETPAVRTEEVIETTETSVDGENDNIGAVVKKRTYRKRRFIMPSVETEVPVARVPGDYTRTSKLLAQKYDRWIDCYTCNVWFLQSNSYQRRRECPRCERHSKLYGFQWPKTEKEGAWDDEERIMDHREVNRFIRHDDEKGVSRRGRGVSFGVTLTPDASDARTETEASDANDECRRPTRASRQRARALRMTM